jgi:DNA-directed RNA polymerase subunit RPC12/RpoP
MTLAGVVPCTEGYAIWSYRCTNCSRTFHMVEARTADSACRSERRAVPRHNVTISGTVKFGADTFSCMVRDVSAAGARVDLTDRTKLPLHFTLIAEGSHLPCQLIWRKERRIGVVFN